MKWLSAVAVVITLIAVGSYATSEAAVALVFGWASFIARVLPKVRIYWPTIIMGVTAFVLFTFGLHWFLAQFRRAATPAGEPLTRRWKFRWTAAIVGMVVVAFAAGISLVGIVHQAAWLANSKEPLLGETITGWSTDDPRNSMKFMMLGLNNTYSKEDRYQPSATLSPVGEPLHGWETASLPYMTIMTRDIDKTQPWNATANQKYFKCVIPFFINTDFRAPALEDDEGYGLNHFSANSRLLTPGESMRFDEVKDGAANTIMLGEVNADFSPWGRPNNVRDPAAGINRGPGTFGGPPNRGGAYFSMADGAVRLIAEDVDPAVLKALSTPADGDETSSEGD